MLNSACANDDRFINDDKIINNVGHYSFFFMALVNRHQPPAFNNVHQTTPSGVPRGLPDAKELLDSL